MAVKRSHRFIMGNLLNDIFSITNEAIWTKLGINIPSATLYQFYVVYAHPLVWMVAMATVNFKIGHFKHLFRNPDLWCHLVETLHECSDGQGLSLSIRIYHTGAHAATPRGSVHAKNAKKRLEAQYFLETLLGCLGGGWGIRASHEHQTLSLWGTCSPALNLYIHPKKYKKMV